MAFATGAVIPVDGGLSIPAPLRPIMATATISSSSAAAVRAASSRRACPKTRRRSVLLLEAGGGDRHPFYHLPAGFAKMTKGIGSWGWSTVPQKHMKGRVFNYTQAKVIGGGSTINAQIYTRGHPPRL